MTYKLQIEAANPAIIGTIRTFFCYPDDRLFED
jgi:hypothetical protein